MANAFQQNAFQNNAYQIDGAVDGFAFQQCAFQYGAFQVDQCGAPSARSGYWRLFFTQLQEEALKKGEEHAKLIAVKQAEPAPVETPSAQQPTTTKKLSKPKRRAITKPATAAEKPIAPSLALRYANLTAATPVMDVYALLASVRQVGTLLVGSSVQPAPAGVVSELAVRLARRLKRRRDDEVLLLLAA